MPEQEKLQVQELQRLLHDLKLPITVLQSLSDILHKMNNQEELQEYFYMLDRNIRYITRISASIKDTIAKIDDEDHNIYNADIIGYTETLVDAIRAVCEIKNIELIFECKEEYAECNLNWRVYERILLNVLQNSLKHAKKCTEIKVILKVLQDKIIVKISDNGKNCEESPNGEVQNESSGEGLFIITTLAKKLKASVEHKFECEGMLFNLEIPNNEENKVITILES